MSVLCCGHLAKHVVCVNVVCESVMGCDLIRWLWLWRATRKSAATGMSHFVPFEVQTQYTIIFLEMKGKHLQRYQIKAYDLAAEGCKTNKLRMF